MAGAGTSGDQVGDLLAELAAHAVRDLSALDRAGLRGEFALLARGRAWLDARHGLLTRLLQRLAEDQPAIFPEADIAEASNVSRRDADQAARRAETLGAVPEFEVALTAGEVSSAHVDAMGRAMKRLDDEQRDALAADGARLARIAAGSTPEQFDKRLRAEMARLDDTEAGDRLEAQRRANRLRSWTDPNTGMVHIKGEFDPETGLLMLGALDNAVDAMFHRGVPDTCPEGEGRQDHLRALALAAIINRDPRTATDSPTSESGDSGDSVATDASAESGTSGPADEGMDRWAPNGDVVHVGDRTDMLVVIDLQTLLTGLHQRSLIDNGHDIELPIESYRRMACTAGIIPIVLNGDGVVLDEGRRQRLATRNQRRALRAMYQTSAIPGCRVRTQHCEPDHIWTWEHHGPSNLNNLVHP